jgi:Holliday junction resolvase-like predicted endonuclease
MIRGKSFTSWHVGVAAEAVAAALFARCGFDVSVQYGANQPEYDLIVAEGEQLLKVSVKGSQDGSWGLCQSYLTPKSADYHSAINSWLSKHKPRTIFCFVQFKNVNLTDMPRVYLARPEDVAARLHETAKGRGDTILYECHEWSSLAVGAGEVEKVPDSWRFSLERVKYLLAET